MKITLITSNQNRHKYLTNLLSKISKELFVVQEKKNFLDRRLVEKMTSTSEIKKNILKKLLMLKIRFLAQMSF